MRVLAGIGAFVFLYLALIPAGLIYSTLDSACAGPGCESSTAAKVAFTAIYSLCLIAVLGTAALFAGYAATGSATAAHRLPRALAATGGVIGAALFVLFAVAFPLGGAVALALALLGFAAVRTHRGSASEPAAARRSLGPLPDREHTGNGTGNGSDPG
ncbi:MAG TPA: hypothetical protein VKA36_06740 [Solirubrobacterales bacterium]|nr:hypothetical protein [Solirubrobacterales bacterium]